MEWNQIDLMQKFCLVHFHAGSGDVASSNGSGIWARNGSCFPARVSYQQKYRRKIERKKRRVVVECREFPCPSMMVLFSEFVTADIEVELAAELLLEGVGLVPFRSL